jgi:sugar phosphate isomerase/epimerase
MASRGQRIMPGEDGDKDVYVDGFRALKEIGYDKYVSFECGTKGDRATTVTAAVNPLREQWENA